MQTDNQPPLSFPGGGSLTLPAMSGNTPPTPQTTATTQQSGDWQPFEHGMSTPSDAWLASAFLACVIVLVAVVIIRAFFGGSAAAQVIDQTNHASPALPFVVLILFFVVMAVGLAMTGVKLW